MSDSRPPIPPGWELDEPDPKRDLMDFIASGGVVDGDTLRLQGGPNARLYGYDAFESDQLGYRPDGGTVPIGQLSTNALDRFITPQTDVRGIGKQTFGRPVVVTENSGFDNVLPLLWQGQGLAAPDYLGDDPQRRAEYLEAERLGRLNNQGAHATQYLAPDVHRKADRWNLKIGPDEQAVFTSDLPELRPEFQRLTDAEERDFFGFLANKSGDPNFSQADLDAYWKAKGREASEVADQEFIEAIRSGQRIGNIDYSSWDAATLADFKKQNAFAGMRPEVQEAYGALLSSPDATPESLAQFAEVNGMTFDPRDVSAFFEARRTGGSAPIPLPLIDPGDGRLGAGLRGFGDPLGFLDEMGAVPDALGMTPYRESIFNSDRSFGDIYENNLRQNRAIIDYDETNHPYVRAGGQLASGFALPFGGGVRGAAGLARAGAAEGAIYGFGSGDGTLGQRLANVPLNALGGAVVGGTLGKGIDVASPVVRDLLSRRTGKPSASQIIAESLSNAPAPTAAAEPVTLPKLGEPAPVPVDDSLPPIPDGFVLDRPSVANMDAEDAMPSLSSPRIPDTIDVNASRATRMMDGPTEAMINAATARVVPGDVLPRPANEIQSLDEFAAANDGLYPEVRAPNERAVLEARQFPSRANPDNMLNRRGPLDLVAYVRSEGGVADFRGELKAAGLSNAPRRGDDFAGGENRLGPLLNDESGATLDEMAQRAWEAGYFPDYATRPSVDEFVTALGDTYRGVNRTFRPDDFAEIDAFNAARDQRLAVERARQEGAPLAEDMGQPATLDDIIANTPPATAYDDWNNAVVSKVGNVRIDKLDTPQDIGQALKIAENIAGGFDAARRGQISQAETRALAQDLGMSADDLLTRRKGQAFNAEEAYAARAILGKSASELVNMARRIQRAGDEPGDELLAAFRKALVRHTAIQEQVAGATAEAGRALSAFRMAADSRDVPGRVLSELVNSGGGKSRLKDAANAIIDLEADPANLNRFIEKASKPRFRDKLVELWINSLLSGPQTHVVNMLSNTLTSVAQIPEHAVAAGMGAARRVASRDAVDSVTFSEVGSRAVGMLQGAKEGAREFARALRTGEASDFVSKVEDQGQKAISGLKGEIIRTPTRLLTAEDELFKGMARRMELTGLAMRKAHAEGLKGDALRARSAELFANPTDDMIESALDYGRYVTFQRPLGEIAGPVSRATQAAPVLKLILPFVRTPTNLFKFAAERSPAAPLLKEWRKDFAAGGPKRDLAIARVMVGSGFGAAFAEMAVNGLITGSPPSDQNRLRQLRASGWQEYSVKLGDTYYSYKRLDPFALTIGAAADMATLGDGMTETEREEGAGLIVASILGNLSNKTWLSGVSDMMEALNDPERSGGTFVKRLAGSLAVPTGVSQVARWMDPTMREAPDTMSYIQSRIPGMSDDLLPRRDMWGQPIVSQGGVGPDFLSPIWASKETNDPIVAALLADNLKVGKLGRKVGGQKLSDAEYNRYQALAGPVLRDEIAMLLAEPSWSQLDQEGKQDELDKTAKASRAIARELLRGGEVKNPPIPSGFEMAPIPEGFELVQ
ncbi:thermonuclease family protein [Sphingopyxis sp. JAI128]|uniref:thermonuclease family protein n=1 Tax=Sphingopyxis sp. JAI128 TaxID=2723066 RepID=UPI00160DB788|nr:hypothetical protein [Sphingopyxis sp. JAI128]MBB6425170.1 endonuclease YncB(thermonuclease family) [Sphingopyxis sp. JAI128]